MKNHYSEILTALAAAKVRFVVAGGVAVVLHGVERMTMDIDVAVDMSEANLRRFLLVMRELGLKPRVPVPAEFILDPANVTRMVEEKNAVVFSFIDPNNPLRQVDLFLLPELSYPLLSEDAVEQSVGGQKILIASIDRLLALKRRVVPARAKDLHDIAELERLAGGGDDST